MKTKTSLFYIATVGFLTATTALWNSHPAHSQTKFPIVPSQSLDPDSPAPIESEVHGRKYTLIPLKHIKPHVMLSWLCPSFPSELANSNPKSFNPYVVRGSSHDYKILDYSQPPSLAPRSTPILPDGIESITPDDAKDGLIVVGTEEGIKKLQDTIRSLDRPHLTIELETRALAFREAEFKAFCLDFDSPARLQNGTITPTGMAKLNAPLSTILESWRGGPMSEIKVPRASVVNNLTTKFDVFRSSPVSPIIEDLVNQSAPRPDSTAPLENQTRLKFQITPTINLDNTITLLSNITARQQVGRKGSTAPIIQGPSSEIQSVLALENGETIAIRVFAPSFTLAYQQRQNANFPQIAPLFKSRNPSRPTPGEDLIIFLTPHISNPTSPPAR